MSQWGVEIVIGRLLTDDVCRRGLKQRGREWLTSMREHGIDLDDAEIAALMAADARVWTQLASRIDGRLHRRNEAEPAAISLTTREKHVLRGVFEGLTNKQIAEGLSVTVPAVKSTLQQLFRKARVRTRAQLVRVAIEGGR